MAWRKGCAFCPAGSRRSQEKSEGLRFGVLCYLTLSHLFTARAADHTISLYTPAEDSALTDFGWAYFSLLNQTTPETTLDGTRLDTLHGVDEMAGWLYATPKPLPTNSPIVFSIELQLIAESHVTPNRAGFSLLILREDVTGIEVGFWTDRVWVQGDDPLFIQAESSPWDTTTLQTYALTLHEDRYSISVDAQEILSGPVRNYSTFDGLINPYRTPNLLFIGDNTRSASGSFHVGPIRLTVDAGNSVPDIKWTQSPAGSLMLNWEPQPDLLLEQANPSNPGPIQWEGVEPNVGPSGSYTVPELPPTGSRWFRLRR